MPALTIDLNTFDDDDGSPEGLAQGSGALTHLGNFVEPNEDFTVSISDPQFNGVSSVPEITSTGPRYSSNNDHRRQHSGNLDRSKT